MDHRVVIKQCGNNIQLSSDGNMPLSAHVQSLLLPALSFVKKTYLTPYQRRVEGISGKVKYTNSSIYDFDSKGRLCTCAGFLEKLKNILFDNKIPVFYKDMSPKVTDKRYDANKLNVERLFSYRPKQEECLNAIINNRSGIINAPTAFGKGALICMVVAAFPKAKIDIITKRVSVVETLYERLSKKFHGVGQVGGGVNKVGERITVYTADSMHKADAKADIVLADEGHELMADSYSAKLARYENARMYTFSASPKGRYDGTDIRMEALFGQQIFKLSYSEAVRLGLVVPIKVIWKDVDPGYNPVSNVTHDVARKRHGIWTNMDRNEIIAETVKQFGDSQILIMTETLEHVINLLKYLPNFTPVYATCEENELRAYRGKGLIDDSFPVLDRKKRRSLREQYEKGELRHVIATGVWAVGVDFTHLEVLVRADGGASEIASIQVPGRVARIDASGNKREGILVDFRDQFDEGFKQKARMRFKHYREMEWDQVVEETNSVCPPVNQDILLG